MRAWARVALAGSWRGVGEGSAQPWRVLPTGSRPYSPRVAKSIRRSAASVSRAVILFAGSNISSYKVEGGSDGTAVLQVGLQKASEMALECGASANRHVAELLPPVAPQTPEAQSWDVPLGASLWLRATLRDVAHRRPYLFLRGSCKSKDESGAPAGLLDVR